MRRFQPSSDTRDNRECKNRKCVRKVKNEYLSKHWRTRELLKSDMFREIYTRTTRKLERSWRSQMCKKEIIQEICSNLYHPSTSIPPKLKKYNKKNHALATWMQGWWGKSFVLQRQYWHIAWSCIPFILSVLYSFWVENSSEKTIIALNSQLCEGLC